MNNKYYAEIIGNKCCVLLNGSIVVKGFNTLGEAEDYEHHLNYELGGLL